MSVQPEGKLQHEFRLVKFQTNQSLEEADQIFRQRLEDAKVVFDKFQHEFLPRNCPYCEDNRIFDLDKFHDTYGILQCCQCAGKFVNPVPPKHALEYFYNEGKCNAMLTQLYQKRASQKTSLIVDARMRNLLEIVKDQHCGNVFRILEVGCNTGAFVKKLTYACQEMIPTLAVDIQGIDIDAGAIENGKSDDATLNIEAKTMEDMMNEQNKYNLIIHFELIEHVSDLPSFMHTAYNLLCPGGLMYFTTPNVDGYENVALGYNAYCPIAHALFPPFHLNGFSLKNMVAFALHYGFGVKSVLTPGKLDVDMVSCAKAKLADPLFIEISSFDDHTKAVISELVQKLNISSHMQCIFFK